MPEKYVDFTMTPSLQASLAELLTPSPFLNVSKANWKNIPGNLVRAAVEMAKDWRTDKVLRRLEALMAVADAKASLILTGNGDVIEPENSLMAIGSGGPFAQAAAKALMDNTKLNARNIVEKGLTIAADICVYTNQNFTIEELDSEA